MPRSAGFQVFVAVQVTLALVFGVFIYLGHVAKQDAADKTPTAADHDLASFLERHDDITRILLHGDKGTQSIEVQRAMLDHPLHLASGPPSYIFDTSGRLVDWTIDNGEDPGFVSEWGHGGGGASITAEEAMDLLRSRES